MRDINRSVSQVLYGFLPGQVVDIDSQIRKVKRWRNPINRTGAVDIEAVRREMLRQGESWEARRMDGGFCEALRRKESIAIYSVDPNNGVEVDVFPNVWICRSCHRVYFKTAAACVCGEPMKNWNQLHFVGIHECGNIKSPYIKACPEHHQLAIKMGNSNSASDIVFFCPVCQKQIQKGLGLPKCDCGQGNIVFAPSRSLLVCQTVNLTIVNYPDKQMVDELFQFGGSTRAIEWILDGMPGEGILSNSVPNTTSLIETLIKQGISEALAKEIAKRAVESGEIVDKRGKGDNSDILDPQIRNEALAIAYAFIGSKKEVTNFSKDEQLVSLSEKLWYCGLERICYSDRFPIFNGFYGFTRGKANRIEAKLNFYTDKSGALAVYGEAIVSEALFFALDPLKVLEYLKSLGFGIPDISDRSEIRQWVFQNLDMVNKRGSIRELLKGLIHSYSHKVIRSCAFLAGIDISSLSEILVPSHLGFFVFANVKGDFVLGGLQALFEFELKAFVDRIMEDWGQCPLDPACGKGDNACIACLFLPETSCRGQNRGLSRLLLRSFIPED
ncbi:MAG TPA: hypothetical protein VK914_04330 [bacterium]|jgi:hypothetical protein|nr:hypothetical protein [bacterium]